MSWSVDAETVKHLKCYTCGCYLSIGPVTFRENHYSCGRCQRDDKNVITIFTALAQTCKFPCRYDLNGCSERVLFGEEINEHESLCAHRPSSCLLKSCEWRGYVKDITQHFSNKHKENCAESLDFTLNVEEPMQMLKVVNFKNGQLLLLKALNNQINGLRVEVSPLLQLGLPSTYNLILTSSDKHNTIELKNNEILNQVNRLFVPPEVLQRLANNKILATFFIENNLKGCPCYACGLLISLYYFTCNLNHTICSKCYKNNNCSECNAPLKRKSNYQLMREGNDAPHACCNAIYECHFAGTVEKLQEHEKNCMYDKCLVRNCTWEGVSTAFIKHIKLKHTDVTHKDRELIIGSKDEIVHFMRMDDQMFIVKTASKNDENLQEITVNLINAYCKDSRKWKVMITFQDNSLSLVGDVCQFNDFTLDYSCSLRICSTLLRNYRNFKATLYHTI